MIYSRSAASLSLLLGASGAVSAAATLPHRDARALVSHTDGLSLGVEVSEPKPKHVPGFRRAPGPDDFIPPTGIQSPQGGRIVTTKEASRIILLETSQIPSSSPSTLFANPLRSTMDLLDLQQTTSGVVEGGLDLMTPTDEGSQRIATLGYSGDGSDQPPFELWSEKQSGSLVFLDPTQNAQDKQQHAPTVSSSNYSMPMLIARAVPFELLPDLNITDLAPGPLFESIQGSSGSTTSKSVIVRIKAAIADKSGLKDGLCATYYRESSQSDNWVPMRLLPCDDSYLSGIPVAPRGTSETQLWQYNPGTHEVKPMLMGAESEATAEAFNSSVHSAAPTPGDPTTSNSVPETTATPALSLLAEVTGASNGGTTQTDSAILAVASQTREDDNGRLTPRGARRTTIRRQGPASAIIAIPIVDPYTLIFYPKVSAEARPVLSPPSV